MLGICAVTSACQIWDWGLDEDDGPALSSSFCPFLAKLVKITCGQGLCKNEPDSRNDLAPQIVFT